jgi:hypothetical protein
VCGGSSGQVSVAAEAGCVGCGCGVDEALVLVQWVVEALHCKLHWGWHGGIYANITVHLGAGRLTGLMSSLKFIGLGLLIQALGCRLRCRSVNLVGNSGCKVAIWSKLYSRVVQCGRVCDWNV